MVFDELSDFRGSLNEYQISGFVILEPLTLTTEETVSTPADLLNPPQLPDGAYSLAVLEEWAQNDFEQKYGETPSRVITMLQQDGTVRVAFEVEQAPELEAKYSIDPVTGTGSSTDGTAVNLPQTGCNDPAELLLMLLAFLMLPAGLLCLRRARTR